ncbi:MAG: FAD-dependent oxidoreductase [Cellulosilyticaceae bacterium]
MNESLWIAGSKGMRFKALKENIDVELLIIGGGLVGVNTAYLLSKEGVDVTLVDAGLIGYSTSGRNTGKLTPQSGLVYAQIKKKYGIDKAKEFYNTSQSAFRLIEETIKAYNIPCELEKMPSYIYTERLNQMASFEEEYKVYEELGIQGELVNKIDLPIHIKIAISQTEAGAYNPKKYIDGLVPILVNQGVKIYENTPVTHIQKDKSAYELTIADTFKIKARQVILCSQYPFYDHYSFYLTRLRPEASYIVAGEYTKDFPHASFINLDHPTRSFRPYYTNNKKWLLIGGDNHKVGQDMTNHYEELMAYGRSTFGIENYAYKWGAQDYKTSDEVPYIGYLNEHSDNMYVATGFNKWGNINAMVAARLISRMIVDKKSSDVSVYDPSRSKDYFTGTYIKENSNTIFEWIKSKIKPTDGKLPDESGSATIIKIDGKKYGVYKGDEGKLHILDITCPHMGAELNWNQTDKTWDCPCHGSRFSYEGKVVKGPATYTLHKYGEGNNPVDPEVLQN